MRRSYFFIMLCIALVHASSDFCYSQYTPQQIYRLGLKAYYEANFQEAVDYFNEYINLKPRDAVGCNFRGLSYQGLNRYQDALNDFSNAITIAPAYVDAYVNRGYLYIILEMNNNAVKDFNDAIKYDPNQLYAYTGRASAYVDLDKYDFALKDLNAALNLDPNAAEVLILRSGVYLVLNDTLKALDDIEKGLRSRDSVTILSKLNRGLVYLFLDDALEMLNDYDSEVQSNPLSYMPYFKRGYMNYLLSKYSDAKKDFLKASDLNAGYNKRLDEVISTLLERIKLKE